MTRHMIRQRPATRDDGFRNHPGNTGRNPSLSALWELFHNDPSLPFVTVADNLHPSWE